MVLLVKVYCTQLGPKGLISILSSVKIKWIQVCDGLIRGTTVTE